MIRHVKSAVTLSSRLWVISLLRAMSVHSQSVGRAMSMSARRGISAALSARLDTRGTKVCFFFVKHTVFTDVLHLCHNCDGLMKFTSSYDEFTRLNFLKDNEWCLSLPCI
jgi:hypothetical protein